MDTESHNALSGSRLIDLDWYTISIPGIHLGVSFIICKNSMICCNA